MEAQMVHNKLKQHFPNLQNINMNQLPLGKYVQKVITSGLPHLSLEQLHSICHKQQKQVMNKVIEIKNVDIYQEIATICPMYPNIRQLSTDQITKKIYHYSNKITTSEQQVDQMNMMEIQDIDSQVNHLAMYDQEHRGRTRQIRDIFADDQQHLLWSDPNMYELRYHQ